MSENYGRFKKRHNPWNKGKKLTKEHKEKLSKSHKGKTTWMKGKKHSEETLKKMSISQRNKDQGYLKKLSESMKKNYALGKSKSGFQKGNNFGSLADHSKPRRKKGFKTNYNHLLRSGTKMKEWRDLVFKRDDYICQDCNMKGGYLHSHHIVPFSECLTLDYEELIFDIDNGLTLCKDCHLGKDLHKNITKGGVQNFTNFLKA